LAQAHSHCLSLTTRPACFFIQLFSPFISFLFFFGHEDALSKPDKVTQEESLMTAAHGLRATHGVAEAVLAFIHKRLMVYIPTSSGTSQTFGWMY